jgi:hypothetical protein
MGNGTNAPRPWCRRSKKSMLSAQLPRGGYLPDDLALLPMSLRCGRPGRFDFVLSRALRRQPAPAFYEC